MWDTIKFIWCLLRHRDFYYTDKKRGTVCSICDDKKVKK